MKTLFLCGFMGVGKSTVGPLLAQKRSCAYFDTDEAVTAAAGASVTEIFAKEGEASFRAREKEALMALDLSKPAVVALGGGILKDRENLEFVLKYGDLIYLSATPATLASRLEETSSTRPLLAGRSGAALQTHIAYLLNERLSIYQQATLALPTDGKDAERVATEILQWTERAS